MTQQKVCAFEKKILRRNFMSQCKVKDAGVIDGIVKGKAIPLQAWASPKCSRRLRLPDFKTLGT